MPDPALIAAILDFEGVLEKPLAQMFAANEVNALTSQQVVKTGDAAADKALTDAGYTLMTFKKPRPRVEISFLPGAGAGEFAAHTIGDEEMPVETSWSGQYKLDLITEADIRIHAAFRTMVRFLMHTQLRSLNGNQLELHKIQTFYRDAGTTPVMKTEEGYFQTTMLFDIDFSLQDYAWETLAD